MKNKMALNPFLRIYAFLFILISVIIIFAIGSYYYIFSIPEPRGISPVSWTATFTNNFSFWIRTDNGEVAVSDIGLTRLNEYRLWLQIIDENGQEVFSHNKPEDYPKIYTASELILLNERGFENGYTIFTSTVQEEEKTYSYIIGFPYAIGRYTLFYNGERLQRLLPVISVFIFAALAALIFFGFGYGVWLSGKMSKITNGIKDLSSRNYQPLNVSGVFGEIYAVLNKMDRDISNSERLREDTERSRREWITNITHDLKTPLSPIKGYAELLADAALDDAQEYGAIITKNITHVENLINDLKMVYQLESGEIPYNPQSVLLTRYIKELVIDIVNDPAFSGRDIQFNSSVSDLSFSLDPVLFRRAVQNIIINAVIHNTPDTKIEISVVEKPDGYINIIIRDDGAGISEAEQAQLFERYYRGTSTDKRPEGSGLGLAIAKQIVMLHGGVITVNSKPNEGSEFIISLTT